MLLTHFQVNLFCACLGIKSLMLFSVYIQTFIYIPLNRKVVVHSALKTTTQQMSSLLKLSK